MTLFDFDTPQLLLRRPADPPIVLEGATLIDGTGAAPVLDSRVLISGHRVTAVNMDKDLEVEPVRIDLRGRWIMPGLIDAHVHLDGSSTTDPYRRHLSDPRGTRMLRAARQASATLATGCTTIRDVGSPFGPALRRAVEGGVVTGPRVVTSGPIITATDGAGDPRLLPSILTRDRRLGFGIADGVEECAWTVRTNLRDGSDLVSVMLGGGLVGEERMGHLALGPEFSSEELRVMCEEGHRRGVMISAHAPGMDSLLMALECGVDTIEHPAAEVDDAVLARLRNKGTCVVSTIDAFHRSGLRREASQAGSLAVSAVHSGVPIAVGSAGSGASPVSLANEIEAVYRTGVGVDLLISALTLGGARALGIADEVGTIEAGKLCDILVLEFDPYRFPDRLGSGEGIAQIVKARPDGSGTG